MHSPQPDQWPSILLGRWGWIRCLLSLLHTVYHLHVVSCAISTLRMCNTTPVIGAFSFPFSIFISIFHFQFPFPFSVSNFHSTSISCFSMCQHQAWKSNHELSFVQAACECGFPRLYAAASLKRRVRGRRCGDEWRFSAALCRGLIEAPVSRGD